jgi:hypothetical protein
MLLRQPHLIIDELVDDLFSDWLLDAVSNWESEKMKLSTT